MMKLIVSFVILVLVVLIGTQLYRLNNQRVELENRAEHVDSEVAALKSENQKLIADIEYFSNFQNLVKEFKTLFNYRNPGEKLIIIVPKQ